MTVGGQTAEIIVVADAAAAAEAAATRIESVLEEAVADRGVAHFATTGGSTPGPIYRILSSQDRRSDVDWSKVHLWWGDERYVPRDHPMSNYLPAETILLNVAAWSGQSGTGSAGVDVESGRDPGLSIPPENVHPVPTTESIADAVGAGECAARYAGEVLRNVPVRDELPVFDLVLLGMGPDGHVLSVFPDSPAFDSTEIALAIPAPTHIEPHIERITLNPRILDVARTIVLVALGSAKAPVLREVLGSTIDDRRWPAQRALRSGATWILDREARPEG